MTEFKIFVSSTFKDMYAERDILHRQVSAILAKRIAESNLDCKVKFVDLRWGIDDRADFADRSEFIIEKCFTSISECDLFLCILGNTIGSVVDEVTLLRYSSLSTDTAHGYTELEIEYAKKHFDRSKIIFLCSSASADEESGVKALKEKIALDFDFLSYDKNNDKVSPEFISHCVEAVFSKISKEAKQRQRSNPYFRRDSIMDEINEMAKSKRSILLFGENGTGKTAILDCLGIEYEALGYEVYLSEGLCKGINSSLPRDLSLWVGSKDENLSRDIELLKNKISKSKRVILIADKIDDESPGDIFMLYRAFADFENVTLLMSLSDKKMLNYLKAFNMGIVSVGSLLPNEIAPYMLHIASRYGKRLFEEIVSYVANRKEAIFGNALYLELLTDQLCIMDSSSYTKAKQQNDNFVLHIIDEMIELVNTAPKSIKELIDFKIADFDKYLSPEFSHLVIGIITSYQSPIHLKTLRDIYNSLSGDEWDEINYYTLCFYLREFIVEIDEQLYYISPYVKEELESRFESIVLNNIFERAVFNSLVNSGLDNPRLYFSALNLDEAIFYEAVSSKDMELPAFALGSILKSEASIGTPAISSVYYSKIRKIISLCGADVCCELFNEILLMTHYLENENLLKYISLSYDEISKELTNVKSKISLLTAVLCWFNTAGLEHHSKAYIQQALNLLATEEINDARATCTKELFDLLYYVIALLGAFDQAFTIKRLLFSFRDVILSAKIELTTPLFIEAVARFDKSFFADILNSLDLENPPTDKRLISAYINCLKHKITHHLQKRDVDTAYPLSQKMYDVAKKEYEENPSHTIAMYDYTQALNLYGFVHMGDRVGLREELYDDMYKIRLILTYAEPDSFVGISSLYTAIAGIIRNNVKISISYEEMLHSLIDRVSTYAQRGNIRVGWLIINMFKELSENSSALNALRKIIFEIDAFLEPIISNTDGNTDNLIEIIESLLNVYHYYCEARILPLDEGKHLLKALLGYASRLVDLSLSEYSCTLYNLVSRELFMILIQGSLSPANALKAKDFIDYEKHTIALLEKNPCKDTQILATSPDCIRIFAYSMTLINKGNGLGIKMIEMSLGKSILSEIQELILKCYDILRRYIIEKAIHPSFVEPLYLGASVVKRENPNADIVFDEIIKSTSAILMDKQ